MYTVERQSGKEKEMVDRKKQNHNKLQNGSQEWKKKKKKC